MNRSNPAHAEELWGMVDLVQQVGAIGILIVFGTGSFRGSFCSV